MPYRGGVNLAELRTSYADLVVAACEWRAVGVADPREMADDVFARLDPARDHTIRDLYPAINDVVATAYRRFASGVSVLDRLRSGSSFSGRRGERTPSDVYLDALSTLRHGDRQILQLRYWDALTDAETAEVLGLSADAEHDRLATAAARFHAKVTKAHPNLAGAHAGSLVAGIKPGEYHRYPPRGTAGGSSV